MRDHSMGEPRVRVVMMQRDEGDMLARWLGHYAGLFGFDSLTILDNGSADSLTLNLLRDAEARGAVVIRDHMSPDDFLHHKGRHVADVIRAWDAGPDYDFALPVDCDEILAVFTDLGLVTDHGAIRSELRRLLPVRCALRLDMSMFNVPGRPGWFAPDRHFHKSFLPARSIEEMDNGFHAPTSRLAPGYEVTRLTYLHWHNRAFEARAALARAKLAPWVDTQDRAALAAYAATPGVPCGRLAKSMLLSKAEYGSMYDDEVKVFVPDTGAGPNYLTASGPVASWRPDLYLAAHDDVRRLYTLTPLHHYLRGGFLEGRPLSAKPAM